MLIALSELRLLNLLLDMPVQCVPGWKLDSRPMSASAGTF